MTSIEDLQLRIAHIEEYLTNTDFADVSFYGQMGNAPKFKTIAELEKPVVVKEKKKRKEKNG